MRLHLLLVFFLFGCSAEKELDATVTTIVEGKLNDKEYRKSIALLMSDKKNKVNSSDLKSFSEITNNSIKNIKVKINRNIGELQIIFDFDPYIWPGSMIHERDYFPYNGQFLIRLFDKNGQYLEHFETAELFFPEKSLDFVENKDLWHIHACSKTKKTIDHCNSLYKVTGNKCKKKTCFLINKKNNVLNYKVSQATANYVSKVEFGFVEPYDVSDPMEKWGPNSCKGGWRSCLGGLFLPKSVESQSLIK